MSFQDALEQERTKASLPRPAFADGWSNALRSFESEVALAEYRLVADEGAKKLSAPKR